MYLSTSKCFKLDEIVKSFEVAIRSYVSLKILGKYRTMDDFKTSIQELKETNFATVVFNSGAIKAKINKMHNNVEAIYESLQYSEKCMVNKDYDSNDVLYLSDVFDLVSVFYNPLFFTLSSDFNTNHEFVDATLKYTKLRNYLSHPASSKIKVEDSNILLKYIDKILYKIDTRFFWFVSRSTIVTKINEFKKMSESSVFLVDNLDEILIDYKKLIMRENELSLLNDYILGKSEFYRKSGSVVLYGYGGVGKTAIVTEFLNVLAKRKIDGEHKVNYDFVLYFTSKEEKLDVQKTTGDLIIQDQRRVITSYDEFVDKLYLYLSISTDEEYYTLDYTGIIVIDNIETMPETDRQRILTEFIKKSPLSIQFIITSRNEERCDESIHINGFRDKEVGLSFIDEYLSHNDLNVDLTKEEKRELVSAASGNTLILILSLTRLNLGKTSIDEILYELNNVSAQNTEIIANFMYKNTFDYVINQLEDDNYNPIEILRIISYYDEPVDMLTINLLCEEKNIKNCEHVCKVLSNKLILNKNIELYELNEFASKFVFIKMRPNSVELSKLKSAICNRKKDIKKNLEYLEVMRNQHKYMEEIISEWKPRTYVDKLAFAEVYNLYSHTSDIIKAHKSKHVDLIEELNDKFVNYELSTAHPYIRYQKARCYQRLLQKGILEEKTRNVADKYFEEAIMGIEYDYTFIQETNSYAYILWLFGQFKTKFFDDSYNALMYFQRSKEHFEYLGVKDETYYKVIMNICDVLFKICSENNEPMYLKLYMEAQQLLHQNKAMYESIKKFLRFHSKRTSSIQIG